MTVPWQFCETGSRETGPSPATPRWVPRCRWTAGPRLPHISVAGAVFVRSRFALLHHVQ